MSLVWLLLPAWPQRNGAFSKRALQSHGRGYRIALPKSCLREAPPVPQLACQPVKGSTRDETADEICF